MNSAEVRYRGFYVVKTQRRWVIKTWRGDKLGVFNSLDEAKADIDRIMQGNCRTDAGQYGCTI